MDPPHRYRKNDPVWWDFKNNRPLHLPKTRISQAGWVKDVNQEQGIIFVAFFNEERKEEVYAVPQNQIRPRHYS